MIPQLKHRANPNYHQMPAPVQSQAGPSSSGPAANNGPSTPQTAKKARKPRKKKR